MNEIVSFSGDFGGTTGELITLLHYFDTRVPTMVIKRNLIARMSHQKKPDDCGENRERALFAMCNMTFHSEQQQVAWATPAL